MSHLGFDPSRLSGEAGHAWSDQEANDDTGFW
jgi:hypothetical protein